jgi:threonine/homoserine/homoserine lactone efflux protein
MAISALRSSTRSESPRPDETAPRSRTYLPAVLTNLANPKVVLFYLAFVPQFITAGGWPTGLQILLLGALVTTIGLVMDSAVGLATGTCSALLRRRPSIQRWLKRLSATIFAGLAVRMLVADQP